MLGIVIESLTADFNARVGANVKWLRVVAGLSQTQLAEALSRHGFSAHQQTVLKIEKGSRPLRLEEAVQVAEVLDIPVTDLLRPLQDSPSEEVLALRRDAYDRARRLEREKADLLTRYWNLDKEHMQALRDLVNTIA